MSAGKMQIAPDLWLDARRAVWLPKEKLLAVGDLHLGYAWAHRLAGQLMPITPANDTLMRLSDLERDYEPERIVVLGDVVHRAMALPALEEELRAVFNELSPRVQLTFIAGNHDRELQRVLGAWLLPIELKSFVRAGKNLLIHGDNPLPEKKGSRVIMGHEHPAISISDGVTTCAKCPCFMISDSLVIVPAFSRWAAGTNVRIYPFMSRLANAVQFDRAVAIMNDKLLPVAL